MGEEDTIDAAAVQPVAAPAADRSCAVPAAAAGAYVPAGARPAGPATRRTDPGRRRADAEVRDPRGGHAVVGRRTRRRGGVDDGEADTGHDGGRSPVADPSATGADTGGAGRPDPRVRPAFGAAGCDRVGVR